MLAKPVSAALAILAFAAQATAYEAKPYRPQLMKSSVRDLFGVVKRQGMDGYKPETTECGQGDTCEEACGSGYATCVKADHCYNVGAGQLCCPDGSGNSCDAGFYCAQDKRAGTWCCPDGMGLAACAVAYTISDGLVSETPKPATSAPAPASVVPTSAVPTSVAPASVAPASHTVAPVTAVTSHAATASTSAMPARNESSTCTRPTLVPSTGFPAANGSSPTFVATGAPGHGVVHTAVPAGAASHFAAPAGLVLAAAAAAAAAAVAVAAVL